MAVTGSLAAIFGRRRFDIRPGTDRIASLLSKLGNPERKFRSIHVVGTNGKGSTASFIASMLKTAGYRTGLFTSPHLVEYTERFRVDGNQIDVARLDRLLDEILGIAADEDTFFELTTAIACHHFAESSVEIAVMEAGMGGRSDATAAVSSISTVITPVSMDHSRWLGDSVDKIASEKIAIAESQTPIFSSVQPPEVLSVIESYCSVNCNCLKLAGRDFNAVKTSGGTISFQMGDRVFKNLIHGIPGDYQLWNAATAIAVCTSLTDQGIFVDEKAVSTGLSSASWPGRMQRFTLENSRELIVDGAHNTAAAQALLDSVSAEASPENVVLIIGIMEDKDITGIVSILKSIAKRIIPVAPAQERAFNPRLLAEEFESDGSNIQVAGTVEEALELAMRISMPGELIVAAGSLFVAGEVIALMSGVHCNAVRG